MTGDEQDGAIVERARRALDRQADALDEPTRAKLRAARLRALSALGERRRFDARPALAAAGTALLGLSIAVVWWLREPTPAFDAFEDVEILIANDEDWELYDDLDFYRWLEETETI